MAYIRTSETDSRPAGIYYRQIAPSGTWSDPILLYSSRYLRAVKAEEANIQILAPDSVNVSIVWDDTIREQVYFAHSADNGLNWNAPLEIDRRGAQDIAGSAGPSFVDVGRADEVLILTWSAGHELDQLCNQYASISRDGGATWTTRQPLPALPGCFVSTQFISTDSALLLLGQSATKQTAGASVEPTTYLLAWDGSRWSDPQIQEALANFTNLDTNQAVNLQCQQALGEASSIRLLGCDANDGRDIWITGREAGDIEEWFPPPPVWQGPQQVSGDESDPAEVKLLAAADGNTYVLWYEENGTDIFQSGWDGQNWTAGRVVVTAQQGNIASLSVASGGEQIYRAWEDSNSGLQFSTADTTSPFAWSAPYALMPDNLAASAPALVADAGGNVFLAYAVQLNEERGIYLLHSADAGETWSEPRQIFDGSAAQWDMVDWPFLARTDNGQLHLVWTQRSLPPDGMPLALAYSNSDDLGRTWSEMEVFAEVNSSWSRIMGGGERTVHRLWSEDSLGRSIIWHQASLDGGLTWSQSQQVAVLTSDSTPATTLDTAQRPHLLAIDSGRLSDSVWNGATWENDEGLDTPFANGGSLDATADNMGRLIMSFVGLLSGESAQETSSRLFALHRVLDLPDGLPAVLPTMIPTPALIVPTATVAPQPTATVFFSTEREPGGIDTIPGLPIGTNLIFGIIPALIIVAIGLFVGIRIVRK